MAAYKQILETADCGILLYFVMFRGQNSVSIWCYHPLDFTREHSDPEQDVAWTVARPWSLLHIPPEITQQWVKTLILPHNFTDRKTLRWLRPPGGDRLKKTEHVGLFSDVLSVSVCLCLSEGWKVVWSQRKTVLLWAQISAPTPPTWVSWATITQYNQEKTRFMLDWRMDTMA